MSDPEVVETEEAEKSQEITVAQPRRAPLVASTGGVTAIIPRDIDQAYRLSTAICSANMAPKAYDRDPNKVMVGILHGMEVGFTPMAALQSIAVINGMPSIWGDGALALIEASGLLEDKKEWIDTDENGGLVAHCEMKRKGRSWTKQSFSWQDAKIAKLDNKDTYKQYGKRMLQRRARAWCMTDGFADVLRGLHIREAITIQDVEDEETPKQPETARPTRENKADTERARKVAVAQDKQFRDTMRETPVEPAKEPEPTEPEKSAAEPDLNRLANQNIAAVTANAPATVNPEHEATERVMRRKLTEYKSAKMFRGPITDYAPELAAMKAEDPKRYAKLMADIVAKHPELKGEVA